MSASVTNCDCPCPDPTITEIPGVEGAAGTDGSNGFATTTQIFAVPAKGALVIIDASDTDWMQSPMVVSVAGAGYFIVQGNFGGGAVQLEYMDIAFNTESGNQIPIGAQITNSGPPFEVTPPAALTDNTGATVSDTIAAGVGITTLAFYIDATAIADGDLLTDYVPGYAFKILKFDARCAAPVTTAAKASTLNLEIVSTNLTGGVIQLAGLYAQGAAQAGSAVTGNNTGAATDSFSIEASSTTAFIEGAFWLLIEIQNLDSANAIASLAGKTNEIITALS